MSQTSLISSSDPPVIPTPNRASGLIGALPLLMLPIMVAAFSIFRTGAVTTRGSEMSMPRAVFVTVNAATLTGFETPVSVNEYKPLGQRTIFALTIAGSFITLFVAGCCLARIVGMTYSNWQILQATVAFQILFIVVGANFLVRKDATDTWEAVFQAASAFGNSGLVIGDAPGYGDWRSHAAVLPLIFLGGLGIPVLLDLLSSVIHLKAIHPHTTATLVACAIVYLAGTAALAYVEHHQQYLAWLEQHPTADDSGGSTTSNQSIEQPDIMTWKHALVLGSTETINSRSAGWPFEIFSEILSRPSQWIVLILMMIGAAPAGCGGGIRTTTLYSLVTDGYRLIRGLVINPFLGWASAWIVVYLLGMLVFCVLLIANEPQAAGDRVLFLVVSAISNVGTSQEPITLSGSSLYILSAAMLFGRFVPLGLLWWAARGVIVTPDTQIPTARLAVRV